MTDSIRKRILMHDFAGYPYPIQISRELARRGHRVHHVYCGSIATTPTGQISPCDSDPETLSIHAVMLDEPLQKYSFVKRWKQENEVGHQVARQIQEFSPDVVVSANSPLDAHKHIMKACKKTGIPFVFWVQDLLGVAAAKLLSKKLPVVGHLIGSYYRKLEINQIKRSKSAILLTDDFVPILRENGIEADKLHVIENWAPITELPVRARHNAWSTENNLNDRLTFIYAGTIGLKHDPEMLIVLAKSLRSNPTAVVVVLSQGSGAEWLKQESREQGLENLIVRDYEPFSRMPEVLGSADVLVALLEKDAGIYSVPSKILAYLCAGRPLLLSIPTENLAARIVASTKAGIVVKPGDRDSFAEGASRLMESSATREQMGAAARDYAERTFCIDDIADRFEAVLNGGEKHS